MIILGLVSSSSDSVGGVVVFKRVNLILRAAILWKKSEDSELSIDITFVNLVNLIVES